jgi:hypothetical protein
MKKWEVKYRSSNAGAGQALIYVIEAQEKNEARQKFVDEYPLEEIISIQEV